MQVFHAIDELQEILGVGITLLTIGLTLTVGDRPLRLAALITLFDLFGLSVLSVLLDQASRVVLVQIKAGTILLAYAAMTFVWKDRWIIALTALQTCAVLLHTAIWFDDWSIKIWTNGTLLNAIGWSMLGVLLFATFTTALNRGRR